MPSPSRLALVSGLVATSGVFYLGAWIASAVPVFSVGGAEPSAGDVMKRKPQPDRGAKETVGAATAPDTSAKHKTHTNGELGAGQTSKASEPLTVMLSGIEDRGGKLIVIVFDDQAAYRAYDPMRAAGYAEQDATVGSMSFTFNDLVTGPYAIAAFHDENGNNDLDMDGGLPKEGYGISGAGNPYEKPSFENAAVDGGVVLIPLHYFN
ncbi:MAG: DUF2141 domain-containing protein [Pseudomonadota bacterium]